jgi:hypothetical protein
MAANVSHPTPSDPPAGLRLPGLLLGLAFGGFFDGILLHQVLQWHHLLSGLSGGRWGDLRVQLLVDGLFHALMYVVAAVALVLLVRRRASLVAPGAGTALASALLASLPPYARILGSDVRGPGWFFSGTPPTAQCGVWRLRASWLPAGCSAWTRA